jgi:hypothetical protein
MAFIFNKNTFEEIFTHLDNTKNWLENIGINTLSKRFDKIYNLNKLLLKHSKDKSISHLLEEHDKLELGIALNDGLSFINIYHAFKDEKSHILPRSKLKRILEGSYYSWNEISTNTGDIESRNILFELETAAFFKKAGVEMIGFDDNDFIFEGNKFNVQCKRIFSEKRIRDNIDEAARQFTKRMAIKPNLKGMICLSIDKLIGLEEFLFKINNINDIKDVLERVVLNFTNKYRHLCNNIININILAVFYFFHASAVLEEEPHDLLITCRDIECNMIPSPRLTQYCDSHLIDLLKNKIDAVNIIPQ